MTSERRVAVTLPGGPNIHDTIERTKWAEARGYTDAWFGDGGAPDALTLAGMLGGHTHSIRVGTAVTPVYTRSPTVLAATAYTVGQALPGRFVLGLGSSSQTMMEGWNGIPLDRPLTRVKETAECVRAMLTGAKSDYQGDTVRSRGYRQPPMEHAPPIYLAALRPKMIEMAAGTGDGVIFNLWPKEALPKMMQHVRIGAEAAGKDPDSVEVVNRFMVCVTDDVEEARKRFRASFAPYYATPVYNKFLAWAGYEDAAAQIREGWAEKDRGKTAGAMSDEMVDAIGILGSADHCRARIAEAMDGGVNTAIIAPLAGSPEEMQATLDAFTADAFTP
jgi:probable F420-dependent oxidoreductase